MTHELHINAGLPVQLFFEGKDDQHFVDKVSDLFDSAFAPCPNLWANVIKDRRACLLQSFGEPQVEIREINENGRSRRIGLDKIGNTPKHAIKRSERADDLKWSDDGGLADVALQLNARPAHSLPAKTVDPAAGKFLEKAARHFGAVHVARGFARNHDEARRAHGIRFFNSRN